MDSDDPALQPVIVLRVVIRSPDLDTFVAKYSRFVKDDRIFIFTKSSQPPGTRVRFTLELSDGQPLIHGEGTVTRVRPDSGDPTKPPGMELKFVPLDDASRELVARMLKARDGTGQFREESTGARTAVRDPAVRDPAVPTAPIPLEEPKAVLPPLQKTGKLSSIDDLPVQRQDESGAVTLAQAPPGARAATDLEVPSTSPSVPVPLPPPPPTDATAQTLLPPPSDDKQSGGFSTPTPLPAPFPPAEEFGGTPQPTRLQRPSPPTSAPEPAEAADAPFHADGPAPPFAEAFRDKMPGGSAPAPGATVPANPFSEVSDGAIEYFVEWSLEQSTAPKPKVAEASFANVSMATPRAVKRRTSRVPLLAGIGIGLLIGLPVGGAAMWVLGPTPAPVIVEHMPTTAHEARAARAVTPEPAVAAAPPAAPTAIADLAAPSTAVAAARAPLAKPTSKPAADKPAAQNVGRENLARESLARENLAHEISAGGKPARGPSAPEAPAAGKPAAGKPAAGKAAGDQLAAADPAADSSPAEKPAEPADATDKPARKGQLQVVTRPPGASVTVDGEARGKTPLVLSLPAGTHDVSVTHERYATVTQPVDVPGKLDVTLKRPPATLHVESDPPGGEVIVEGKPRGKTPVDVTLDAFHHYDVEVMLLGTKPWHKRVALKPPQTDVTAKLSVVHNP